MIKKILGFSLFFILVLQMSFQAVPVYAADEVLISTPKPGNYITGDYILRYSIQSSIKPVSIIINYIDSNGIIAQVDVTPKTSSTASTSYETKISGLGAGENTITVKVISESGISYQDQRDVTVVTNLTNIMMTSANVPPYSSDRNQYKNLLKANNTEMALDKAIVPKDNSYIDNFVDILFEESSLEEVRPDIVFSQMMLETGWLTFGHDVQENQNNFGGIGAVGGGAQGNLFIGIREGIRTNVQHLKAYASTSPLNGTQIDPRFGYVKKGIAPWVEYLGYPENPNNGGWAMSPQYGFVILGIMDCLAKASVEPFVTSRNSIKITQMQVRSFSRGTNNPLDLQFIDGFAPNQEVRVGVATNSYTENRFIITNLTTETSLTTPWSDNGAVYFTPETGLYRFQSQVRAKGGTDIADSQTQEIAIGDVEDPAAPLILRSFPEKNQVIYENSGGLILRVESSITGGTAKVSLSNGLEFDMTEVSPGAYEAGTTIEPGDAWKGVAVHYTVSDGTTTLESTTEGVITSRVWGMSRIYGSDRYGTASEVSRNTFDQSDTVVLTTGANFPDALVGGVYGASLGVPVLFTQASVLPAETLTEMERLGVSKVKILGGTVAVSDAVEQDLIARGYSVERIAGTDRYATAANVALKTNPAPTTVFLASGAEFADAMSIIPIAAKNNGVVLLTQPNKLPSAVRDTLLQYGVDKVVVIGGQVAVTTVVTDELTSMGISVERVAGDDRYSTNVAIYERFGDSDYEGAIIGNGINFPDALSSGVMAYRFNQPLILVRPDRVIAVSSDYLEKLNLREITVLGGPNAVSDAVYNSLSVYVT